MRVLFLGILLGLLPGASLPAQDGKPVVLRGDHYRVHAHVGGPDVARAALAAVATFQTNWYRSSSPSSSSSSSSSGRFCPPNQGFPWTPPGLLAACMA